MSPRGRTHLIWSMQTQLLLKCHLLSRLYPPVSNGKLLFQHISLQRASQVRLWMPPALDRICGERTHESHFTICHQKHKAEQPESMNKTEIDFICFSISSRSLSGTRCHLLFSGQAWGSIAESDTEQNKGLRLRRRARVQNKALQISPLKDQNCRGRSHWYVLSLVKHRIPSSHRYKE